MTIFIEELGYDIGDLGFDKTLVKISIGGEEVEVTPELANIFTSGTAAKSLTSGEFLGNTIIKEGYLQSENFESGSAGWKLTPTSAELNVSTALLSLDIPDTTTTNSFHVDSNGNVWWGATESSFNSDNDNANAYILKDGTAKFQNVTLENSVTLKDIQSGSEIAIQGWQHDMTFSASDSDTVAWGSGTITLLDGTIYSIDVGNTGNMLAVTYIYLDIGVSETALQTTTTASDAVGSGKILVCVAQNQTSKDATFQVMGGLGSVPKLIAAENMVANTITANEMNVGQLSAISADIGSITAGSLDAVTITGSTITGSLIQTSDSTSENRIKISSTPNNAIEFWSEDNTKLADIITTYNAVNGLGGIQMTAGGGGSEITLVGKSNMGSAYFGTDIDANNGASFGIDWYGNTPSTQRIVATRVVGGSSEDLPIDQNWIPYTTGKTLGSSSKRWNNVYSKYLNIDDTVTINNAEFQGDLIPDPDDNWNLGSVSNIWAYVYTGALYYYNQQKLDLTPDEGPQWKNTPIGFYKRWGTPGSASNYEGYIYYDTSKENLVYSDGAGWFEVKASAY